MNKNYEKIVSLVCDTLVEAGSTFREDKKKAYKRVIASEDNERAKWVLETVLANAEAAEKIIVHFVMIPVSRTWCWRLVRMWQ